jgi:hypothetical protein
MSDRITKIGEFTQYVGDAHPHSFVIANVSSFSAISEKIVRKGQDTAVSSTYYTTPAAAASGNTLTSSVFGHGSADAPAGDYLIFLTGTYDTSHIHTWYLEITILPKK